MPARAVLIGGSYSEVAFEIRRLYVAETLKTDAGREPKPEEIDAVFEDLNREVPQLVRTLIRTRAKLAGGVQ